MGAEAAGHKAAVIDVAEIGGVKVEKVVTAAAEVAIAEEEVAMVAHSLGFAHSPAEEEDPREVEMPHRLVVAEEADRVLYFTKPI